ncbi:hypothetical protein [Saccharopolyspora sp. CA-218241]
MSRELLGSIADDCTGGTDVLAAPGLRAVVHFGLPEVGWSAVRW